MAIAKGLSNNAELNELDLLGNSFGEDVKSRVISAWAGRVGILRI
jgi:hypothetical protein